MNKLNEKQRRFADEYIRTGNASESARLAGYSEGYATTHVYKLIENDRVKAYINQRLEELKKESIADQDEILQFLTKALRGEVSEKIPLGLGMGEQKLVDKNLDAKDRLRAAELLGKRYMMWTEKHQVENITPTFVEDVPEDD